VRQHSTPIPILHRSYIRNAREGSGRWRSKIRRQHRLPDRKNPYVLVIDFPQQLSGCRGPLQTNRSSGRQHNDNADRGRTRVERGFQRSKIARRETEQRWLWLRCRMSPVKVIHSPKHHHKSNHKKRSLSTHDLPAKRSATKFAITCGKKMNATTAIAENHKRKVLTQLGLQLHCFARHDL